MQPSVTHARTVRKSVLTHQVLSETLSAAPVHKHNTLRVNVGDVHRGTLHFGEGETHLHVDVVYVLQEVGEVPAGCSDRQVVTVKIYRDKRDRVNCHLCQAVCPGLLDVFSLYGLVCQGRSALHLDFV